MKRNKIIGAAIAINRFTFWLLIALVTVFVFGLSYVYIFPETYSDLKILNDGNLSTFHICTECDIKTSSTLFTEIGPGMKLWILLRESARVFLIILCIHKMIKILKSVRDYKTFHSKNTLYFRQIAKYTLVLAFFGTVNFIDEGQHGIGLEIGLPFSELVFALFSLSLSEVFKEGQLLQEDKDAMI
ncbi:DUF2975 domain-containing protein [Hyunsoonleella rubra]|uniref:DUF2975 domain-containing protein n=1 Tax=Hyunsoonleella rubra TaxID=1737062 RepID=A0ABW5TA10_9FLAO